MTSNIGIFKNQLAEYESFQTYGTLEQQTSQIENIINEHDRIISLVRTYNSAYNNLDQKSEYKDFNYEKADGDIWVNYKDKKKDVKDVAKEDAHTMIVQYNSAYLVGMISIATILVTTYVILKK